MPNIGVASPAITAGQSADTGSRLTVTGWILPALVTFFLGVYNIRTPELWRDEISSWNMATRSLPQLLATFRHTNAAEGGYYLILHFWIAVFGDSVVAMRMPSVLAMTGAAICVALTGRRLAGYRAGLAAGLVFAVIPSISRFAQEVRPYALGMLAAALATLMLLRALAKPTLSRWAGYAVCIAAVGYLNEVGLAILVGHAAWPAVRWLRDRDIRLLGFAAAGAVAIAATFPVFLLGTGQARSQLFWIPRATFGAFVTLGPNLFYSYVIAGVLAAVGLCVWARAGDRGAALFATSLALAPVIAVWIVSQGSVSYFLGRYLLFTLIGWALLAGLALAALPWQAMTAGLVVLAVLGAHDQQIIREPLAHYWASYPTTVRGGSDFEAAARTIDAGLRPGDGLYSPPGGRMSGPAVEYYLSTMTSAPPVMVFIASTAAQAHLLYDIQCQRSAACLHQASRIWYVQPERTSNHYYLLVASQAAALKARYRVARVTFLDNVTVVLFVGDHP